MRYLVVVLAVILFIGITTLPISSSAMTSGHGCAPPVPPGIPGSPAPAPATSGIIDINEVLLTPGSTWNCSESGTYFSTTDSWIELYNTQNQPYNLYSAHAAIDSGPNTNAYYFPLGASIAAHGYLVVFPRTNASFLSTETSTLRLVIVGVAILDQVTVPPLGPDQSYARTSDGASTWAIISTPTIDASNTSLATPTLPSSTSRSRGGSGSIYLTSTPYSRPLVNGTQPQWSKLQLPTTVPTSSVNTSPNATTLSSSPSPTSTAFDLPRKIALTILVIALALTLFWCWRRFTTP